MRIPALCLLIAICCSHIVAAQDVITQKNGTQISAKVLKVNTADVEYKLFDNQDGPLHTIYKSDIALITYQNGTKDVFSGTEPEYKGNLTLAERGAEDAKKFYKPSMGWPIAAGVVFTYGFLPAVISYATPPRYQNLNYPSQELMNQSDYREAYTQKAYKIKKARVGGGFGIGLGICATIVAGILVASVGH